MRFLLGRAEAIRAFACLFVTRDWVLTKLVVGRAGRRIQLAAATRCVVGVALAIGAGGEPATQPRCGAAQGVDAGRLGCNGIVKSWSSSQ